MILCVVRAAGDLRPQIEGVVVVDIDGDPKLILGQREVLGDQSPRPSSIASSFEIVAEGKVAEHLEEGVVARGVADIVEVVVLAAGAHAFLRGGGAAVGALFPAGEDVLELHHAGIGEHQQSRVVARHQRTGGHHGLMAVAGKKSRNFLRMSLTPLMETLLTCRTASTGRSKSRPLRFKRLFSLNQAHMQSPGSD